MKRLVGLWPCAALFISLLLTAASVEGKAAGPAPSSKTMINSISGQIWDPYNKPVPNLFVELQNELYSTLSRQRTTSAGYYNFTGITSGSYKIKVLTLGTDYLEQTQDVQVINLVSGGSDNQYLDFHLRFDPRRIQLGSGGLPEEVFAQEGIPEAAEKLYRKGIDELVDKKREQGLLDLEEAVKLFPTYFNALSRLGQEYVDNKEYRKALPHLIKAIDINQRSFQSFYALGYACYQLNEIPSAIEAARAASIIKPASPNAQLLYGTVLRLNATYDKAEAALLQAQKLAPKPIPQVHWQLALLYNKLNRNKESADQLELYLKADPNSPDKLKIQETIAKLRAGSATIPPK
ncbi:MAG: tetratricopeptide repeat protein [Acidobacteria bacterium]|nr:tetratricopeptide repeat protein [Acidobacteriota bacterium]